MIKNIEPINLASEVVKLEMIDRGRRLDHIKELINSVKGLMVLERIVCNNCLTQVNPLCEVVPVNIRNMEFGTKSYTVLEPQCPVCSTFIPAEQFFHIES